MKTAPLLLAATIVVLAIGVLSCGSNSSSIKNPPGNTGNSAPPQGIFVGMDVTGRESVELISLPNQTVYVGFGAPSGTNLIYFCDLEFNKGTWSEDIYTGTITNFDYCDGNYIVETGTVSFTYSNGNISGGAPFGELMTTVLPTSQFNFNTPALLSSISGSWSAPYSLDRNVGGPKAISIDSSGNLNGTYDNGCSISGKVYPDTSNKDFFDLSITYGGPPCVPANQSESGIAVLRSGQLEFWATSGTTVGIVFVTR